MMIQYRCNLCNNMIKKIFNKVKVAPFLTCACGGILEKQLPEFTTSSVEVVDNGAMIKKVELRKEAVAKAKEKGDKYADMIENRDRIIKKDEN